MTICSSVVEMVFLRFGSLTRWIFKGGKMKLVYHLAAYVGFPSPSMSFIWLYSAGREHYMNSYYSCSSQQSLTVFAAHMHPQELGLAQSDAHCSTTEPWSHPNVTGQYWSLFKNFLNFRFRFQSKDAEQDFLFCLLFIYYLRQGVTHPGWPWIHYGWGWSWAFDSPAFTSEELWLHARATVLSLYGAEAQTQCVLYTRPVLYQLSHF